MVYSVINPLFKLVIEADLPLVRDCVFKLQKSKGEILKTDYTIQNDGFIHIPLASLLISLKEKRLITKRKGKICVEEEFYFNDVLEQSKQGGIEQKFKKGSFLDVYQVDYSKKYFFWFENIIMMQRCFNHFKSLEPFANGQTIGTKITNSICYQFKKIELAKTQLNKQIDKIPHYKEWTDY